MHQEIINQAFEKRYPDIQSPEIQNINKEFPASISDFPYPPPLTPGEEILVITPTKSYFDQIQSLFYATGASTQVKFTLQQTNTSTRDNLYIKKSDYLKVSSRMPEILPFEKIQSDALKNIYLNQTIQSLSKLQYLNSQLLSSQEIKEKILSDYQPAILEINLNFFKKIHLIQFIHREKQNHNFLTVYYDGKRILHPFNYQYTSMNARPLTFFRINQELFLLVYEWMPQSGQKGNILYRVTEHKLEMTETECDLCD